MKTRARPTPGAALIAWLLLAFGCESRAVPADAGPSEPSPNASILPAPLATGPEVARAALDAGSTDAGLDTELPPPSVAREDEALPADSEELHDASGVTLRARFRWPDVVLPGRLPEMNVDALDRARAAASFDLDITSAAVGRLRIGLAASRFVLAGGSEFRARSERYGHALVWPDHGRYVVIQAGALRTTLNERRADVIPLAHAAGSPRGPSQAFGFAAERVRFTTALGKLELDQAHVTAAGAGGALLCRFLVELVGIHPDCTACRAEYLPVRGEYVWSEGGAVVFEVIGLERSAALEVTTLRTPPEAAEHRIGELPAPPSALLVERTQLRAIRLRPAPVHPAKDAPKDGLLLVSADDLLRYALVDGLPVARVEPHAAGVLLDMIAGTYSVAVRTFLGDEVSPPATTTVPGRFVTTEGLRQDSLNEPGEGSGPSRVPRPAAPAPRKAD
jgi:hypothetical protein